MLRRSMCHSTPLWLTRGPSAPFSPLRACSSHLAILQESTEAVRGLFVLVDKLSQRNAELERHSGNTPPCVLNANSEHTISD
jgi:hypothetical protein